MCHVAISGELGSGKSAVAGELADRLGARVVSTGAIHRRIASARGESALETNLSAEQDASIDELIDGELVRLGASDDPIVFDSRMAWHFVRGALKVHLLVDPVVGAERMLGRGPTDVEGYGDVAEAQAAAEERHASEQRRFLATYDVNIDRLRNYDLVIDTTDIGIDDAADLVQRVLDADQRPASPHLLLSARRLSATLQAEAGAEPAAGTPVHVAYARPNMAVLDGEGVVALACARGEPLVPGVLVAEGDEVVDGDVTAVDTVGHVLGV